MNHPTDSSFFQVHLPDGLAESISAIGLFSDPIHVVLQFLTYPPSTVHSQSNTNPFYGADQRYVLRGSPFALGSPLTLAIDSTRYW